MRLLAFIIAFVIVLLELVIVKKFKRKAYNFIIPIISLLCSTILIIMCKGMEDIVNSDLFMLGMSIFVASFITMVISLYYLQKGGIKDVI